MVGELRRLFVAVSPPAETRLALDDWLKPLTIPGRLAPVSNWHITLRFIGSVDEVGEERLLGALSQTDLGGRFRIEIGGLGAFPNPRRATVAWIEVIEGTDRLEDLAAGVEESCLLAGLTGEERPFRPHLTLSRIRPPADIGTLVSRTPPAAVGWACDRITVFQSLLGSGPPRYEPLEDFVLSR